ncbi:hypothetical protein CCO03_00565 [Comamonas serinivorans]|uniref:Glycosyl transferase family 51 domain-containing protein n=1 Tax=Comamonas serinivorans TaxID=1082851 RepID=A0A1Y0EIE7_9BURK|nr:hypothetical protein CCO03_00565 [Comamonas serinivorans]
MVRRCAWWVGLTLGVAALAVGVALTVVWASLRPAAGEWAETFSVPVPGTARQVPLRLGVPSLIRLATQPPLARWLVAQVQAVPMGPNRLQLSWHDADRRLSVTCAPCTLVHPGLGSQPITVTRLGGDLRRHGEALQGQVWLGDEPRQIRVAWQGDLSQAGLRIRSQTQHQSMADLYAALAPSLPEVARATVEGEWGLQLSLDLPRGRTEWLPDIRGFSVTGLGTEALLDLPGAGLPLQHPLVRAVIAAEDQRFEQHTGLDLSELQQVLQQGDGAASRGASTLTQQLAKLVYTDGERSVLRKARELLYAADMERSLGKARILQLYLAHAPWGEGVVGAGAAAQHYFGRPAARLSTAQAVWLASMLNQPDTHARRWRQRGQVDLRRATWVAQQMRLPMQGLSPRRLKAVVAELQQLQSQAWLTGSSRPE